MTIFGNGRKSSDRKVKYILNFDILSKTVICGILFASQEIPLETADISFYACSNPGSLSSCSEKDHL